MCNGSCKQSLCERNLPDGNRVITTLRRRRFLVFEILLFLNRIFFLNVEGLATIETEEPKKKHDFDGKFFSKCSNFETTRSKATKNKTNHAILSQKKTFSVNFPIFIINNFPSTCSISQQHHHPKKAFVRPHLGYDDDCRHSDRT